MNCRFCQAPLSQSFLDLKHSPVANALLTQADLNKEEVYYPLNTWVCSKCWLVQTQDFSASSEIFTPDYPYFSSVSHSWLEHCKEYVEMIAERFGISEHSKVLEVASNDGYLLQYFMEKGVDIIGVEPTESTAKKAISKGIPTWIDFFTSSFAKQHFQNDPVDLIIGNNVLAHVPDINDFVKGLQIALKPDGFMTFEFPHFLQLHEHCQFDTIYHEHFSYFSLITVTKIFEAHRLQVFDVEKLGTHGGSLRLYVKHQGNKLLPTTEAVKLIYEKELEMGLNTIDFYKDFEKRIQPIKTGLMKFLLDAKHNHKKVVAYGAAAKGNTLLNYCGLKNDLIAYCADANIHKQGKYLPGSHIPIVSPDKIWEDKPDYILILPWNLEKEISRFLEPRREWGGQLVIAIPRLNIF